MGLANGMPLYPAAMGSLSAGALTPTGRLSPALPAGMGTNPFMPTGSASAGPAPPGPPPANRRRTGPPAHTPFVTRGHNSTPSVQLDPAAFAAMLGKGGGTGGLAKKKVVVGLPVEGTEVDEAKKEEIAELRAEAEEEAVGTAERDKAADESEQVTAEGTAEDASRSGTTDSTEKRASSAATSERKARLATLEAVARTKSLWTRRVPLLGFAPALIKAHSTGDIITRALWPVEWNVAEQGLPETIDIYLPGKLGWLEYVEERRRLRAAELEQDAKVLVEVPEEQQLASHAKDVQEPKIADHEVSGC